MKCPKCHFENPEESEFCLECGSKLELHCPQCGNALPLIAKFCNKCGHDLRKPKEAPPIDYSQPQSYTPKFLVDKILTSRSSVEGERKFVTVLFADVANYTSISEKLDPEEVHQIMDGCFKILMDEIHKHEGTINQFTGDGVMALFGAPVAHEDHAQRACHATLSVQKAMQAYSERIRKKRGIDFKIRIGLNSGPVMVGSIGDDLRMDYTAVGDTTNLASRMEAMAGPGAILVSGNTHRLVRDFFEFKLLGKVQVKGKEEPVEAFHLIKATEVETRIEAAVAKGLTKFVGRKNSMAALMEAYDKAQTGSGQVVGIVGEAGVGKSRLILEFNNRLPEGEFNYLESRCFHYGDCMAYLPIRDILRSYFEIKEEDWEFIIKKKIEDKILQLDENLRGILPSFHDLLSLRVEDEKHIELEPKQKREKAFEAIRDLLIRESQSKSLVLAIEDSHWIDKTSEEFLDYLIGWLANARILLILLYRPEYTHQWGGKSYYNRIGLDQLTTESSAELVQSILEGGEVVPELRELILNRAAGNPLFMEELTHTLLENGSIQREDHQYVLSRKPSDIEVPDTIQGIIAARMDRMEDSLKRIMQVASVIGKEFSFRILQTITGMKEELKSYLLNLQGLEFIYEKSLFPELEYIFKHALTQEVAYSSLLLKRRREIHQRIGRAIEEIYHEKLEEFYEMLAYHYSKGDEFEKAYQYLKLSGDKAMRTHSNWEAFYSYEEAIQVLKKEPETEENLKKLLETLQLMLGPMRLLGYPEDSPQLLQEGEDLSKKVGEEKSLANFYSTIGHYHTTKGDSILGREYSEKSFQKAVKIQDVELIAKTGWYLCSSTYVTGRFVKLIEVAQEVIVWLEKTKNEHKSLGLGVNLYSGLHGFNGCGMGWLGNFEEGEALLEKGLDFTSRINDRTCLGLVEWFYGLFFIVKGDWKSAIEHLQNSIKYTEEVKYIMLLGSAWTKLGLGYYFVGELETAKKCTEKGLKIHNDAGLTYWLSLCSLVLGMIHFDSGDFENAQNCIEEAVKSSQNNNEKHIEGISRIWLGRILGKADLSQWDKGEECILKGMKILDALRISPFFAQGYLFLGELYADMSQREKALENLKKVEGMYQEMGMDYWLAKTQEMLGRL